MSRAPVILLVSVAVMGGALLAIGLFPRTVRAQILDGVEGLSESAHRVTIHLGRGVARFDVTMRFDSAIPDAAEVRYRLPIPNGAGLHSLEACTEARCFVGRPDSTHGEDAHVYRVALGARTRGRARAVARVTSTRDRFGRYFDVRAAPVSESKPMEVHLSYVAPLDVAGGYLSAEVVARPHDPRIAPSQVTVSGPDGSPGEVVGGRAEWSMPPGTRLSSAWRFACGSRECARVWAAAAYQRVARDVLILVDRSPSMHDTPEGLTPRVLAALVSELHADSVVRVAGYGRRASLVTDAAAPPDLDLAGLQVGPEITLGASTRLASTAPFVRLLGPRRPLVVVLNDGGTVVPPPLEAALDAAGAELTFIDLSFDGPLSSVAGQPEAPLFRRVRHLIAPRVVASAIRVEGLEGGLRMLGPLRAGEAIVAEGALMDDALRVGGGAGLLVPRARRAPTRVASGLGVRLAATLLEPDVRRARVTVSSLDFGASVKWAQLHLASYPPFRAGVGPLVHRITPAIILGPYYRPGQGMVGRRLPRVIRCTGGCSVAMIGVLSRGAIRRMMQTVEPAVRGCFARERRGRADFSVWARYSLVVHKREVRAVTVDGPGVTQRLRSCMVDAVDQLVVPPTEGVTAIHYPFVAAAEPRPIAAPLEPTLERSLDALFHPREGEASP